ncbi:hypothetical protein Rhe02_09660 [Rhizocola hellebori]|uniref:Uncharacterized protein n=1 Tax=Rhizocola hellebori TaxID=1392758 RepID=A0A8J3Q3Q9_9ACTN|nr:pilin [Rhizocola hellebori]GIH02899.1 hypothetical protein Rhe02_09660 [Rhizocola hellebori]
MHTFQIINSVLSDLSAFAPDPGGGTDNRLADVIKGITSWIMGILAVVATMFLTVGGLRYMSAGGDPSQVEAAKGNFKSALVGYALAVLAPVILGILASILGGPQ